MIGQYLKRLLEFLVSVAYVAFNDPHNDKVKSHNCETRDQDLESNVLEWGRIKVRLLHFSLQLLFLFV